MGSRKLALVVISVAGIVPMLMVAPSEGQQAHRNGFESRVPNWIRGHADAPFREMVHDVTDRTWHSGQFSEHIQLTAENGNSVQYIYPLGKAPINEELNISVWIKANRPGMRLQARVVLLNERAANIEDRLTTIIRGDTYQLSGRWQRLELRRAVKLAQEQQQLMRAELRRDVNFTDAYVDSLILDVYGGPGLNEVWIDDLDVSPLLESNPQPSPGGPSAGGVPGIPTRRTTPCAAVVELNQDRLLIDGKPFFFTGIRYSGTPLKTLRDAGINTIWFDYATPQSKLEEAVNLGFWLVPSLPVTSNDPRLTSLGGIGEMVAHLPMSDATLFVELGGGLVDEQKEIVARASRAIKIADTQRPLTADVWDGFRSYSRSLDLIGVHRWPLMTSLELSQYREWLNQRRQLVRPGAFLWTWVQTHLPDWYVSLVYDQSSADPFREPIGPQPEQIRILTYLAISAGVRGLGFWSDLYLADSHQGRDRLLTLALLNQELKMLEPMLLSADTPFWIASETHGDVKAAVFRCERGTLVLPMWLGKGGQFVPGQSAASQMKIVVPEVPGGSGAWLVSPGEVRSLSMERVPGGTRVVVPEFGLTAAIVFTADNGPDGLLVRLQDQCRLMRKKVAQWNHDLAQVELEKVARIEDELEQAGHTLPDGKELLDNARARIRACEEAWGNGDFTQAYAEAERAMRPMRILMRAQWEQAIRGLDVPMASPYAASFYTLPRHWRFVQQIRQMTPGNNILPNGDFEGNWDRTPEFWTPQEANLDGVLLYARCVAVPNRSVALPSRPPMLPGSTRTTLAPLPFEPEPDPLPPKPPKKGSAPVNPLPAKPNAKLKPPTELGKKCLELEIAPPKALTVEGKLAGIPVALQRSSLALNSPAVRLPPGSLVRISAWIQVPEPIKSSVDGALFYDSVGGEPLAVRVTGKMGWKKFTFYRRVPASGTIYATMALTGIGKVNFDNIKIEPMLSGSTAALPELPPSSVIP